MTTCSECKKNPAHWMVSGFRLDNRKPVDPFPLCEHCTRDLKGSGLLPHDYSLAELEGETA